MPKFLVEMEITKSWTVEMEMEAEDLETAEYEAEEEYRSREGEFDSEQSMADEEYNIYRIAEVK